MAKLTTKERKAIPTKDFALPKSIPSRTAAMPPMRRPAVAQHGTPAEQAEVDRKVAAKYPGMGKEHGGERVTEHHRHAKKPHGSLSHSA